MAHQEQETPAGSRDVKKVPQAEEAERAVLAALLQDGTAAWALVSNRLAPTLFLSPKNQLIYTALDSAFARGAAHDPITLTDELTDQHPGRSENWLYDIAQVMESAYQRSRVEHYTGVLEDRATRRALYSMAQEISELALDSSATDAMAGAVKSLTAALVKSPSRLVAYSDGLKRLLEFWETGDLEEVAPKLPWGFLDLDSVLNPMAGGDLIILAGRPSMGKTTLAMNIAEKAALGGAVVYVRSLEMDTDSIIEKSVASMSGASYTRILGGSLTDDDWPLIAASAAKTKSLPLYIQDSGAPTVADIRAEVIRLQYRTGSVGLIVVDYLQLLQGVAGMNRAQALGEMTSGLKALGKEVGAPVILLSQLNRRVEERSPPRPWLSDLRESGTIEQDADVVLLLYRESEYNRDSLWGQMTEVIVAKQRKGARNKTVHLLFDGAHSRFLDADKEFIRRMRSTVSEPTTEPAFEWDRS